MAETRTYSDKLQDPRWQKMRLRILERDNFKCTLCGDTETTLHVHHEEYRGEPWEADPNKLKTLCKDCHGIIEAHKSDWMAEYVTAIIKIPDTLPFRGRVLSGYFLELGHRDYVYFQLDEVSGDFIKSNYIDGYAIDALKKHISNG